MMRLSKGDLMKLVLTKDQLKHCDSAIPMALWDTCNVGLCCFDCKNWKVINLAELLITTGKLGEILDSVDNLDSFIDRS